MPSSSFNCMIRCSKQTLSLLQLLHHSPCTSLPSLYQLHAHLIISGAISDPYAAGKLLSLFSIIPDLHHSELILLSLPRPATFLYNALLRSYVERCRSAEALALYRNMLAAPRLPNNYTFSFLIRACIDLNSILHGQKIHDHVLKLGWESYDFVLNGLIHMYADCDMIDSARKLFDASFVRDVITWTAMVHGYAKAGQFDIAKEMFDRMPEKNAVSWSSMITAYSQVGMFEGAMELFREMQLSGVEPNHAGIVGALSACGFLGALDQGKWIHAFVKRKELELDPILATALIDMYAKCGYIEKSLQVFYEMPERDVFAFTSIISGLSNHGHSEKAIRMFDQMESERVRPNSITFICVLSACARMGLVDKGRELFFSMNAKYQIAPGAEHYGCLVDLLGRAGLLTEAKTIIEEMSMPPDSYVLGALLNACRVHEEMESAKEIVQSLKELGCDDSGFHVLLSNMYASTYRWQDVVKVRELMEGKNVRKVPGCSLIEIDGVACEFTVSNNYGFKSQLLMEEIRMMDKQLRSFDCDFYSALGNRLSSS